MQINNNRVAFVLTNLGFQALIGHFGIYAIIKHPMSIDFYYNEQFLGILDAIQLIGELLGSILLLFLPLKPIKGYLIFAIVNIIFSALMIIPKHITQPISRDALVCICLFTQSLLAASIAYTQVIFSTYYNEDAKKCEHSVWYTLTFLGDITSLIFASLAVYNWGISWEITNVVWHSYIVAVALLMYLGLGDHIRHDNQLQQILNQPQVQASINQIQNQIQSNQIQSGHQEQQNKQQPKADPHLGIQNMSKCQLLKLLLLKIMKVLKQKNVLLVVFSAGLLQGLYTNLLFWVPYYYINIGEQKYSTISMLGISVSVAIGGLLIQALIYIFKLQYYSKIIIYILLLLSASAYVTVWIIRFSNHLTQLILLFVGNFCLACPFSRISASDPVQEGQGNQNKITTIFLLCHIFRNLNVAFFSLLIGFFLDKDKMSFWTFILINLFLIILVESIRKLFMKQKQSKDKIQEKQENIRQSLLQ